MIGIDMNAALFWEVAEVAGWCLIAALIITAIKMWRERRYDE